MLEIVKIVELNNLFNSNNPHEIKEYQDNKIIISKQIQNINPINNSIFEHNNKESNQLSNPNTNTNTGNEKIKDANKNPCYIKDNTKIKSLLDPN